MCMCVCVLVWVSWVVLGARETGVVVVRLGEKKTAGKGPDFIHFQGELIWEQTLRPKAVEDTYLDLNRGEHSHNAVI